METKLIKEEVPDKEFNETDRISSLRTRTKGSTTNGKTQSSTDRTNSCKTPDSPESARLSAAPVMSTSQTQSPNVSSQQTLHINTLHVPTSSQPHHRLSPSPNLVTLTTSQQRLKSISPPLQRVGTTAPISPQDENVGTPPLSLTVDSHVPVSSHYYHPARQLNKVKRFLCTLVQFGADIGAEIGDRVRSMVLNLVSANISVEEFHQALQEVTNFPLRPFVLPFLRTHLPLLQREVHNLARASKQSTLQYVRTHDHIVLDPTFSPSEASEIFFSNDQPPPNVPKRRASDSFYENGLLSNGPSITSTIPTNQNDPPLPDYNIPPKRHIPSHHYQQNPFLLATTPAHHNSTSFLLQNTTIPLSHDPYPPQIGSTNHLTAATPSFNPIQNKIETEDGYRQFTTTNTSRGDEEWKNIHVMLNCILSMVEKTKRALTILQQRNSQDQTGDWLKKQDIGIDLKKAANEIMMQAVRQTEDRVAEVKRKAEEAVNEVKKQAVIELQKAVQLAESKAADLIAVERAKMEKVLSEARKKDEDTNDTSQSPPISTQQTTSSQNSCWNCGRKANETCSGCNIARYCGSFCQHKDWENHHTVCCQQNNISKLSLSMAAVAAAAAAAAASSSPPKPVSSTPKRTSENHTTVAPVSSSNSTRSSVSSDRNIISK